MWFLKKINDTFVKSHWTSLVNQRVHFCQLNLSILFFLSEEWENPSAFFRKAIQGARWSPQIAHLMDLARGILFLARETLKCRSPAREKSKMPCPSLSYLKNDMTARAKSTKCNRYHIWVFVESQSPPFPWSSDKTYDKLEHTLDQSEDQRATEQRAER